MRMPVPVGSANEPASTSASEMPSRGRAVPVPKPKASKPGAVTAAGKSGKKNSLPDQDAGKGKGSAQSSNTSNKGKGPAQSQVSDSRSSGRGKAPAQVAPLRPQISRPQTEAPPGSDRGRPGMPGETQPSLLPFSGDRSLPSGSNSLLQPGFSFKRRREARSKPAPSFP